MIRAIRYSDIAAMRADRTAGSYCLRRLDPDNRPVGMAFICPCGCGNESWLPFRSTGSSPPSWQWDGNEDSPTLYPSVHQAGMPCKWHGWLSGGYWGAC